MKILLDLTIKDENSTCSDFSTNCNNECALSCWLSNPITGICPFLKEESE